VAGCAVNKQSASATATSVANGFVIMPWELPPRNKEFADSRHGLASLAECGFTVAGFVRPEHLSQCEKLGLRAIVSRPDAPVKWEQMSDDQIDQTIRQWVFDSRSSPAVMGYFITDEPGVAKFPALAKAVAAVRKYAPGKLAYINLYPDYATLGAPDLSQLGTSSYSDYLERFVSEVKPQVISYDNYRVQFSGDLKDPRLAESYFRNLLEVRRVAMAHGLPFWNIVSGNEIRPTTPAPSPSNLLLQAYTTLAAGASGLTWYTYYAGRYHYAPVDAEGNRTPSWSYLKMVNDQVKALGPQMMKLHSTGVYFTSSQPPLAGQPQLPGKVVGSIECAAPVMVGEFEDKMTRQRWAMVVNLSLNESANLKIAWASGTSATHYVSPVDGTLVKLDADKGLWLAAGQGVLVRREADSAR